ncbi:MAG TPA: DUF4294 domain-containing protein [Flavipsychrobacter sp.]
MRITSCILFIAIGGTLCFTATAQSNTRDTVLHVTMDTVQVKARREWANDTLRYRYNQMKYYVTTVMPYVQEAVALQHELEAKVSEGMERKEQKAFVRQREDELRKRFDAEVKDLNETQGVLMVKLIARQTGVNIYDILKEYKNGFEAIKWRAWGKLNGFNLARRYNPDDEAMLENIMEELGYPLPDFYGEKQILTAN